MANDKTEEDLEEWKERALRAEKELAENNLRDAALRLAAKWNSGQVWAEEWCDLENESLAHAVAFKAAKEANLDD